MTPATSRGGVTHRHGTDRETPVDNRTVVVQRDWNGWRTATVLMEDLQDVHWFQPRGAPRPLIHAHVCCSKILSGEIPHDCAPTPVPHRVRVCVLKSHTAQRVFEKLAGLADEHLYLSASTPPARPDRGF
jgi:hypothetical protein